MGRGKEEERIGVKKERVEVGFGVEEEKVIAVEEDVRVEEKEEETVGVKEEKVEVQDEMVGVEKKVVVGVEEKVVVVQEEVEDEDEAIV